MGREVALAALADVWAQMVTDQVEQVGCRMPCCEQISLHNETQQANQSMHLVVGERWEPETYSSGIGFATIGCLIWVEQFEETLIIKCKLWAKSCTNTHRKSWKVLICPKNSMNQWSPHIGPSCGLWVGLDTFQWEDSQWRFCLWKIYGPKESHTQILLGHAAKFPPRQVQVNENEWRIILYRTLK